MEYDPETKGVKKRLFSWAQESVTYFASAQDQNTGLTLDLYGTRASNTSPWIPKYGVDSNGQIFYYESGISTSFDVMLPPGQYTVPDISGSFGCDMAKTFYTGYAPFSFTGKTAAQWILYHELVVPEDEEVNAHRTGTLVAFDSEKDIMDVVIPYRSDWPIENPVTVSGMKYQFGRLAGTSGNPDFMYLRVSGTIMDVSRFLNTCMTNNISMTSNNVNYFIHFDEDEEEIQIYADEVLVETIPCDF